METKSLGKNFAKTLTVVVFLSRFWRDYEEIQIAIGVTVVEFVRVGLCRHDRVGSIGTLSGLFSIETFAFNVAQAGLYDVTFADSSKSKGFFLAGYAIDENIGGHWVQVALGSVGSSTFTATAGKYIAIIGDVAFPSTNVNFSIDVTKVPSPVPEPESWAIMLLGIGFVVYQVRPRKARGSQAIPSFG